MDFIRKKDTAVVVGFASNTRDKTPWNNPDVDIFGLNEEYSFNWWKQKPENTAGWFQIHKRESFMRPDNTNHAGHADWLRKKHPFPILMQEKYADIPSSVKFPLYKIIKQFGTYWTSTLAYAVAFAFVEGYKRVELYGFEMASDSEYWGQRANAAYIIGKARGMGMDVYVPPISNLLTGIRYAYENNLIGARQDLEVNVVGVKNDKYKIEAEAEKLQGEYFLLRELVKKHPELQSDFDAVSSEIKKRDNLVSMMNGRLQGLNMAIKTFDTYDVLSVGSGGE